MKSINLVIMPAKRNLIDRFFPYEIVLFFEI